MNRLFRLLASIICIALFFSVSSAQSPDKILKQATKALGGEKVLRSIKSRDCQGTITRRSDGASGKYREISMQPNLYFETFDLRGLESSVGYSGKSGWARDSRDGLRTLTGEISRDFQAEAKFRNTGWLDYKKEKASISSGGPANLNGQNAQVILFTTAKNVRIKLYFEAVTGLLLREEIPSGDTLKIIDYSDYKIIDGAQEPQVLTLTIGKDIYEIRLGQITHNLQPDRSLFDFPKISNEPLPDIQALLQQVKSNEDKIDELLEKYTYTEKVTKRETDSTGQFRDKESEIFELTFYKGNRIRRLIEKNGKPLSPNEIENENKRIEKRIRNIEKKEAEKDKKAARAVEQDSSGPPEEEGKRISISDILRASKLTNPRRERFRGREVIVFDFEPLPGYKPQKDYEKFFGKTAGAIWVDITDKQVARVESRLVEAYKVAGGMLASLKEGATFVLEQDRINNEIWLPTRADIGLAIRVLLVKGINVNQVIEFGNYKRFNVEAEKEKLKEPPVKPF